MAIAHTANSDGKRQDLVDHLRAVAELTRDFAIPLGAADAGYWLGLWHDVGKYHPDFQAYLDRCEREPEWHGRGPDHKAAGASLARDHLGWPLAMVEQAHHGGLQDPVAFEAWLRDQIGEGRPAAAIGLASADLDGLLPQIAPGLPSSVEHAASQAEIELFLRLLFSALADADSLDTERHFTPGRHEARAHLATFEDLWGRFVADQERLLATASAGVVTDVRREVYEACLASSSLAPGIFRLTVPTGGGKTRSGLAFALRHALAHGLSRVIVAVPYLTITDQIAAEYRRILDAPDAAPAVLEHHSGSNVTDDERLDGAGLWSQLAAENWDAPVIVTTTVQLFDSLFSNRRSACRKLHRLAGAVIILDEAQTLPSNLLAPILDGLRDLVANFGASVVLSTATQPAFEVIPAFAALPSREIVPEPAPLFRRLRRVRYEWPTADLWTWDRVADAVRGESQALVILNTRADAHALVRLIDDPDVLHLSTTLCGAHRRAVVGEIRRRLDAGLPCRLVTTQVVEAGVDIDFPLVLRAMGPFDSILQAAGRCNREGRLAEGCVVVFEPVDGHLPPGAYRTATDKTRVLVGTGAFDPDDPDTARRYFAAGRGPPCRDLDAARTPPMRARLDYPAVARAFRMIDDDTLSVLVPYGDAARRRESAELLHALEGRHGAPRLAWRRLQPSLVSVRSRQAERLLAIGTIREVVPGLGEWLGDYDRVLGISAKEGHFGDLVV